MTNKKQKITVISSKNYDEKIYFFCGGFKRVITRVLDLVFLYAVNLIFMILILIYRPGFSFSENFAYYQNTSIVEIDFAIWKIFLFWIYLLVIYYLYFVLLVTLTKGWTLFGRILNVRIINRTKSISAIKIKQINLFYKEFVLLFLFVFFMLFFALIGVFVEPQTNILIKIFNAIRRLNNNNSLGLQIYSIFLSTIISIIFLIQLFYFINTFFAKKRRPWQDNLSHLYVIDFVNYKTSIPKTKTTKKKPIKNNKRIPGSNIIF